MAEAHSTVARSRVLSSRRSTYLALACFVLPLVLLSSYVCTLLPSNNLFSLLLVSILSGTLGAMCGWYVLKQWEEATQRTALALAEQKYQQMQEIPSDQVDAFYQEMEKMRLGYEHQIDLLNSSVAKSKEQVRELNLEMDKKLEQMRVAYLEFEDLRKEYTALEEEYGRYQVDVQGQLKHKDSLLADYQHTISEQREVIEKKQRYIAKLEGKVRDLMYEIRSLLQLEDPMLESSQKKNTYQPDPAKGKPYDFSLQLSRYLEMAESFMGADHLGGRFLNSGTHRYEIDLRPLIDNLSQETNRIIFLYAPTEHRFLFVSDAVRERIGWSSDKIVKDFRSIVMRGGQDWFDAIQSLESGRPKVLPLALRHKGGQEVNLDCYMGLVTKGPFAGAVIGLIV